MHHGNAQGPTSVLKSIYSPRVVRIPVERVKFVDKPVIVEKEVVHFVDKPFIVEKPVIVEREVVKTRIPKFWEYLKARWKGEG